MKHGSKFLFILSIFFIAPVLGSCGASEADKENSGLDALDAYATTFYAADEPGGSVLVMKGAEVLLEKGYGLANLETGTPNRPETVFRLGPVSAPQWSS